MYNLNVINKYSIKRKLLYYIHTTFCFQNYVKGQVLKVKRGV